MENKNEILVFMAIVFMCISISITCILTENIESKKEIELKKLEVEMKAQQTNLGDKNE